MKVLDPVCRTRAVMTGLDIPAAEAFEAIPGQGVRVRQEGEDILIGNRRLMQAEGFDLAGQEAIIAGLDEALAEFGEAYEHYKKATPAFFPWAGRKR